MLVSVKGTFRNGVAQPTEPVEGREGQTVIITFVEEAGMKSSVEPGSPPDVLPDTSDEPDELMQLLKECQVQTGIGDLAHQHDHYLYGTPKRDS